MFLSHKAFLKLVEIIKQSVTINHFRCYLTHSILEYFKIVNNKKVAYIEATWAGYFSNS